MTKTDQLLVFISPNNASGAIEHGFPVSINRDLLLQGSLARRTYFPD